MIDCSIRSIPKDAPVKEKRVLKSSDIDTLFSISTFSHYGKDMNAFYIFAWRFMVVTGLRRGELAGLQKTDVTEAALLIRRSVNSLGEVTGGKTDNAQRIVALSAHAKSILADQTALLKDRGIVTKWIFLDEDGGMMDTNVMYDRWATYRKQHGIASSLHELRHTFISLAKSDMPEALLKQMVGHSASMDTLGVYGHEVECDLQRTAQIVDTVFGRLIKK